MKKLLLPAACLFSFLAGAFITDNNPKKPLTTNIVDAASTIFGLEFSTTERDSMLENLTNYRNNYEALRKVELTNDVAPALYFNPLPHGFKLPQGASSFKASPVGKVTLPANRNDLAFYSVAQLGELLKTRQITSVELTRFFLERLKTYNEKLLCVVTLTDELALKQARQADDEIRAGKYRGPLHGIPYGAKDLFARKGYKTTWGSVPYKNQTLDYDATIIQRLEKAGAVLCAKLTMGELAMGDVWFGGKTRNPWDPATGSSGSSAGSGSSVSAGLLPFAIGTETLGSIVSPSTVNGVTGLRPTYGRVSRYGAMALSWSMDKIGPMCRSVEDCALVFNAIYGPDGHDPTVFAAPFRYAPLTSLKGIKIGYLKKAFDEDHPTKADDLAALETLRKLGATLIPFELPDIPVGRMNMILSAEAAAAFDELTRSGKDDELVRQVRGAWPNTFRSARFIPAVEYIQANRIRTRLINEMAETMKGFDVYITPTFGNPNLTLTNLTGHPCVALPNGFNAKRLPTSITLMGQLFDEGRLLAVAKAYQDATSFHKKHPTL
ncbi:amidase [Larkinella arboricola]